MSGRTLGLLLLGCITLGGFVQCGGGNGGGRTGDTTPAAGGEAPVAGTASTAGSIATNTCQPPSADSYQPHWLPPKVTPGVCSAQQIADEYSLCINTATSDQQACKASHVAADNGACLDCLYGVLDADASQALFILNNGSLLANVGGCIALVDGDTSDTGCGALTQAADICTYSACDAACPAPVKSTDFNSCVLTATHGVCAKYETGAQCADQPRYTRCAHQAFADYFKTVADLFCGTGPTGTQPGGAAGAGGAAP